MNLVCVQELVQLEALVALVEQEAQESLEVQEELDQQEALVALVEREAQEVKNAFNF